MTGDGNTSPSSRSMGKPPLWTSIEDADILRYQGTKKMHSFRVSKPVRMGLFGLSAVCLGAFLLFVVPHISLGPTFDRTQWEAGRYADPDHNPRRTIADDLIRRYLLPGTSAGRITDLVGEPEGTDTYRPDQLGELPKEVEARTLTLWTYKLGRDSWGMDEEYLYIGFDAQNRVTGAWRVQH